MYGWSFAARSVDEIERLLVALGKHRYLREIDHRLHWSIDEALGRAGVATFGPRARRFATVRERDPGLELGSRDPRLWSPATTGEVVTALGALWTDPSAAVLLADTLREAGIERPAHAPFGADPEEPPHPELVWLDWVLLSVDELDDERHAGALAAMAEAEEEVQPSAPAYVEGPTLAEPELCGAAKNGVLPADLLIWADGSYAYCDYVFRGVARAAKLCEPPLGYRDFE